LAINQRRPSTSGRMAISAYCCATHPSRRCKSEPACGFRITPVSNPSVKEP
jgi:hypothetical protein